MTDLTARPGITALTARPGITAPTVARCKNETDRGLGIETSSSANGTRMTRSPDRAEGVLARSLGAQLTAA